MRKAWLVAKHEYLFNVKKRSFLFGAFGVPILIVALIVIVGAIAVDSETNVEQVGGVGYVDEAGILSDTIEPPEDYRPYASADEARAALDAGEIGAYFVVQSDYLETGNVQLISRSGTPEALTEQFDVFLVANIGSNLSPDLLERLKDPVEMSVQTLDNGRVVRDSAIFALFLVPFIFVFVFIMASQISSSYLMSGVVEEKSNRIMEILITSVTPFQLLLGKIIGLGALGLTQLMIWIVGAFLTLALGQNLSFLAGVAIPTDLVIIAIIYFLLDYFFFGSIMAGIGAVVGSEQESRQIAGFLTFIGVIPFFFIVSFITDPNGVAPTVLTLFPLTSPIAVMLRLGLGSVPTWQLIVSIALLLLTTLVSVWASAKIFRWSLLMYGKRAGLWEILRVLRRPASMGTSATAERVG